MFTERSLGDELETVRERHAPGALVLDAARDFETLDPAVAEELALLVDGFDLADYRAEWLPADAPDPLVRLVGDELTIGAPGDGAVAWTRQTTPPTVIVKPRVEGSPDAFVDFLVAEALVAAGSGDPERFLGFFREEYRAFADATGDLDGAGVYQLAAACLGAYRGLAARETFAGWEGDLPALHAAWVDAGERLAPRLDGLAGELARGETAFPAAAELACSGVKHDLDLPAPFAALDTDAYREYGAEFAVRWAEKTVSDLV